MDQRPKRQTARFTIAALASCVGISALAQIPVDDDGFAVESLGPVDATVGITDETYTEHAVTEVVFGEGELQEIVGPIALYPDDLIAIVLPASTYPLQIVQAARFLEAYEQDSTLEPSEDWDESVVALLNYPDVLRMLDEDIDWTWQLGQAVIDQQPDVIAAVEGFRDRAYVAGNLKTDEYQEVRYEDDIIEIVPIEDDVIYVPYYEPEEVVVYQPAPVYHYYPSPRPVYYYPYPAGHTFAANYFWGVTTAFHIGWSSNYLRVYHPSYWGHPYYGHSYYGHNYRRPSINIYNTTYVNHSTVNRYRDGDYWAPRRRAGARQSDYYSHIRSHGGQRAERHNTRAALRTSNEGSTQRGTRDGTRTRPASSERAIARDTRQVANRPASRRTVAARTDARRTQAVQSAGSSTGNRPPRRTEPATSGRDTRHNLRATSVRPAQTSERGAAARTTQRNERAAAARTTQRNERAATARTSQRNERAAAAQPTRRTQAAARSRPVQRSVQADATPARAPRQVERRSTNERTAPARAERQSRPAEKQAAQVERKADRGERRRNDRKPRRSDR